jgi:HNH endonuclease
MSRRVTPFAVRLWSRIDQSTTEGCHPWMGPLARNGYGYLSTGLRTGRKILAHRAVWQLMYGPIPKGLVVCHGCDNRRCCNPAHLRVDTHKGNIQECIAKGRNSPPPPRPPGKRGSGAKLSDDQVRDVRRRIATGESQTSIAKRFGVDQVVISLIVRHKTYRDVI